MGRHKCWVLGIALLLGLGRQAAAQTMVSNADELLAAIRAANAGTVTTISFTDDITLNANLVPIAANVTIQGNNHSLSGAGSFQIFFVDSGSVAINDLALVDGSSQGGAGSDRGGGGLGAGGALFVNDSASVVLTDVTFVDNTARGGSGGADTGARGGGGGGFHGDGGNLGGGGGWAGDGGDGGGGGGGLLGDGFDGVDGGDGGGEDVGSTGGAGDPDPGGSGEDGGDFEGGGFGNTGGDGGRFGGGGGSSGGNAGDGGDFGGGGGSAGDPDGNGGRGGDGMFGGGGGGSANGTATSGGFGAGGGAATGPGGAGSSLGGAVFVRSGGSLRYAISTSGQSTSGNAVQRAASGSGNPEVAGSDLYVMSGVDATLVTQSGVQAEITGSIAGAGGLRKEGAGVLILSGNNSYSGKTTVVSPSSGMNVLQGDTDSLPGDVEVEDFNTTLRFSQNGSGTYSGDISGGGNVEKEGTGSVTLSGNHTYIGATDINAGTLVFTSSILPDTPTDISSGATLRFDIGSNTSFDGSIRGSGTLDKTGSGRLTLSSSGVSSTFTGTTTVRGGELSLASGRTLAGTVDVRAGGRLGGAGSAPDQVDVTGILAPGAPGTPDTLTVGNLALTSGGEIEIDLTPSLADRVAVTGAATFAAGTTLRVLPAQGDYSTPMTFTVISGSYTDNGITLASSLCLLEVTPIPNPGMFQLQVVGDITRLQGCAASSNQRAVSSALIGPLDLGDAGLQNIGDALVTVPESEIPRALDLMSGEGLAGFQSTRVAAATQFLGTLSQRMRDPSREDPGPAYPLSQSIGGPLMPSLGANARLDGGLARSVRMAAATDRSPTPFSFVSMRGESGVGGFLDGFATFAGLEGDGNTNDTDFNLYGTTGGVDWAFADGALVGAAFGYTRSKLSVSDLATWGTGDTFQGALYGSYATERFYVGGVARYGYTQMKTRRRIAFGSIFDTAEGDFDGTSISGYAEVGLASLALGGAQFQPMAAFQYTHIQTDDFTETGAPGLNLGVLTPTVNSMVSNVGLRVYQAYSMDFEADIIPELRVRYAHEFGDSDRPVAGRFADATTGPVPFTVGAAEIGRDVAIVGAGWTVVGEGNSSLSVHYDATVNKDILAHTITVGVLVYW